PTFDFPTTTKPGATCELHDPGSFSHLVWGLQHRRALPAFLHLDDLVGYEAMGLSVRGRLSRAGGRRRVNQLAVRSS
ncbi:MAG: hypothetical protein ABR529_04390, partial [Actinomycetota bacterium]